MVGTMTRSIGTIAAGKATGDVAPRENYYHSLTPEQRGTHADSIISTGVTLGNITPVQAREIRNITDPDRRLSAALPYEQLNNDALGASGLLKRALEYGIIDRKEMERIGAISHPTGKLEAVGVYQEQIYAADSWKVAKSHALESGILSEKQVTAIFSAHSNYVDRLRAINVHRPAIAARFKELKLPSDPANDRDAIGD